MSTTHVLNGKKFREATLYIPWDIWIKWEAACDRENMKRLGRNEHMLSLMEHLHATLIPAMQIITDKIKED